MRDFFQMRGIPFVDGASRDKHGRFGWINTHCPICGDAKYHLGFNDEEALFLLLEIRLAFHLGDFQGNVPK